MIVDLDSRPVVGRVSACLEDAVGYAGIEKRHTRACAVWPACCHNGSRGRQGGIDQGERWERRTVRPESRSQAPLQFRSSGLRRRSGLSLRPRFLSPTDT